MGYKEIELDRIEASVIINRSHTEVYEYVTDARKWTRWEQGLLEVGQTSQGPMKVGTTFRGANRAMGRRMEWTSKVTEVEPYRKWGQKITSKDRSTVESLTFEPVEGGTRFTLSSRLETRGFFKLIAPVTAHLMQRQIEGNLSELKSILETEVT
jgi:uncharacterized protein YndB with AHSA1/START domain